MLTYAERKWLQDRENVPLFQCEKYCEYHAEKGSYSECTYSPALSQEWCKNDAGNQDWKDAAEFEARVASLLAQKEGAWEPCSYTHCPHGAVVNVEECVQCRIKHARIAVEKEMEMWTLPAHGSLG